MYQHNPSMFRHKLDLASTKFRRLRPIGWSGKAAFAGFMIMTVVYFWYRLPLWNPGAPVLSGLLLAAEVFGVVTLALHVFSTWTLVERSAPPPPRDFRADIFVTTWNEPWQMLRNTLLAAKQVRLVGEIWLLDDGCRPEMEQLAGEMGVRYIARADRSHAKAGNLNNALRYSSANFIALFDCDHAPGPEFLERTLGYFIDPSVAFVQTPQDFYNLGSFQHRGSPRTQEAWHEQTLFYRVIQAGKDYWNATFFCGSCAVLRRTALDDIGGIATGTITEDMHTSLKIHKNGWSAVYHAEALAFGLSPASLEQYETQRLRWGRGAMQVWAKEGILFDTNLTIAQRMAYFMSAVTYFEGWQKVIIYILPMLVLVTGSMPIIWTGWSFILIFSLWLLTGLVVNEVFSRGYAKTLWMEEYNFIRFFTFIKATFTLVIPRSFQFLVTPKRMKNGFRDLLRLWPQILMVVAAFGSGIVGTYLYWTRGHLPTGAFIANLFWLMLNLTVALRALAFVVRKMRQRRADHRFRLPVVARVEIDRDGVIEKFTAIAENLSSEGLRLVVHRNITQANISGALLLPTGPLQFQGKIRPATADAFTHNNVGVQFEWTNARDADPLNSFLYGNTLQWDVNAWAEVRFGPAQLLRRLFGKVAAPAPWAHVYVAASGQLINCLARDEGDTIRVLSHAPLPATSNLTLSRMDDTKETQLAIVTCREYPIGKAALYLSILGRGLICSPQFHREPNWARASEVEHA